VLCVHNNIEASRDKNYDVDGVMSELMVYERRPGDQLEEIRETVSRIPEIAGKSTRTMFYWILLLRLSPEIQAEIRTGNLPVSQGYLFAANLECPDLRNCIEC
jgi:hypothetical protein